MPAVEQIIDLLYESKYQDSGFYERGYELPKTGGIGAELYTIGGLLLITEAVFFLSTCKARADCGRENEGDTVSGLTDDVSPSSYVRWDENENS